MNITKITFISLIIFGSACSNDEKVASPSPSNEELLTANASKNWNQDYSSTDKDETSESCTTSSPINADNEWIFNVNGDFKFTNGTITEVADCDDCCSDLANLVGSWNIFSNGDSISIVVDGRVENDVIIPFDEEELFRARLKSITDDEMVLIVSGDTTIFIAL